MNKKITEKAALKIIRNNSKVILVHTKPGCPVCEYFVPEVLEPLLEEYEHVISVFVEEPLMFPQQSHPVTFFFKDGKCVQHPHGAAPDKAIRDMMDKFYGKPI
jgi:thioredoxin-like negative regulator of GroEL